MDIKYDTMIDLSNLSIEENNSNSFNIELQDSLEILKRINEEDKKVANCISDNLSSISKLIDEILKHLNENSRIFYIGSGTSGRLGILDASECPPTYGVSPELFQGIIAGGKDAVFIAKENAEDDFEQGKKDLENVNFTKDDILIGLTASGRTPYVIGAIKYANEIGALTGSITCSKNSELSKEAKFPIEVVVGAEIVTGSTRMKAGTAQKMILNMISTTIMIKKGKVFSGYMVDVKTTNKKLIERAKRILINTTNCSYQKATNILEIANYDVKLAITMILLSLEKNIAENKLKEYDYNVARLIHEFTNKT